MRRHPKPERISHRGAHQTLPENSIPAFLRAIELGADAIELDVHATSDGVVIVHHDPTVTAPGVATSRVLDLTASELSRFPLAHGVEIPTLEAVLTGFGRHGPGRHPSGSEPRSIRRTLYWVEVRL